VDCRTIGTGGPPLDIPLLFGDLSLGGIAPNYCRQIPSRRDPPPALLRVANWMLFTLRTSSPSSFSTSVALVGNPGGIPGPVAMEDSGPPMSHRLVMRAVQDDPSAAAWMNSPNGALVIEGTDQIQQFRISDDF